MAEKVPCNIVVAHEPFSLSVGKEEEEFVRKAAKLINEKMDSYRETKKVDSHQRLLAIVALDFVMSNLKFGVKHSDLQKSVMGKIAELDNLLSSVTE
ncbi:cell division protein ZapA [Arcicella aquatica]|uniref:Cell division protein ZapA n=1 Tax=Arcicella aquatica TaxID=217141 RepID=A0ABU5QHR9_9BACT|nr:cell division protein ZapA [Arcicella aquatica]MEA5256602.1 cell division protein ZapA [Arcicella aquatica]